MAKYSSSINYKITTSLDASGITKLQAELNRLEHEFSDLNKRDLITNSQTQEAISDINRIQRALQTAFNPKLGMLNTKTLMNELIAGGRSLNQIYNSLGTRGSGAMAQLYGQLGKIDTGMKSVSKTTDKLFNTLGNTVRWGIIASGFQYVLNSAHGAVQYMADLDKSLTNIRLVTDESKESMREFAKYANDAAKSLGNTTVAYTDAALIYAQQGYGLSDQKVLANYTLMTANATGQDTAEVSEQMTALINGFQLSVEDVGSALDVMAKVANTSAADLEELATAASKVASTANTLGVTQEQLTAQIATIVSVTREAPENVGNALKTIYARFGDLSLGETLEDGTDLGKVSSTLQKIGVQVLDSSGAMRDMGLIMEDLMAVWDTLDTATKQGAAVTLAGKYQYNRLMALMENSDMYEGYYDDALNSAGTLEEMQSEYMESLEGKAKALQASFEGLLTDLFDQDDFGVIIEGLTNVIDLFDTLVESIGGGSAALTAFGAIATKTFSNNIGRSISNMISNKETAKMAKSNVDASTNIAKQGMLSAGVGSNSAMMKTFASDMEGVNKFAGIMNQEQIDQVNQKTEKYAQAVIKADEANKKYEQGIIGAKAALAVFGVAEDGAGQKTIALIQKLEAGDAGLEDLEAGLSDLIDDFINTQTRATSLANALEKLDTEGDIDWHRILAQSKELQQDFNKLLPTLKKIGMSDADIDKLKNALTALGNAAEGDIDDITKFKNAIEQAGAELDDFRIAIMLAADAGKIEAAELEQLRQEAISAGAAVNTLSAEHQGLAAAMNTQSMAAHLASGASAVMSLVFAVQSFQALGSIWANDDLTTGEKLVQTLMNGTMAVSMLAMAYNELAMFKAAIIAETGAETLAQGIQIKLKELETKINAYLILEEQKLAVARGEHLPLLTKEAALERAVVAEKTKDSLITSILTTKIKQLLVKLKQMPKAAIAGVAHIGIALATLSYILVETEQQITKSLERTQQQIENSTAALEAVDKSNFSDLFAEFQETGEASEELKTSALQLAEALGVTGAAALIEQENFVLLNKEIQESIDKHKELLEINQSAQNMNFERSNTGVLQWTPWKRGWTDEFTENANFSSADEDVIAATGIEFDSFMNETHGYDYNEQVRRVYAAYDETKAEIDRLNAEINAKNKVGEDTSALEKELARQEQLYTNLGAIIGNEEYGLEQYRKNIEGLAELDLESFDFEGLSYDEAKEELKQLDTIKDYYAVYGEEAGEEFLRGFLGTVEGYQLDVASEQLAIGFNEKIQESSNGRIFDLGTWQNTMASEKLMEELKATENLSEEEKIQLINLINWDLPIQDILANIKNAIDTGSISNAFVSTDSVEDDTVRRQQVLSKYDVDVETADAYEEQLISTTAELNEEQERLVRNLENAKKANGANSREAKKAQQELDDFKDTTEDLATDIIQTQKGLEALSENFEDHYKILSTGDKSSFEYVEAMQAVKTSIADVLNISSESLSNTFIEENLGTIKNLVDGNLDALDDLRIAAGQEIALKMYMEGNLTEEQFNLLKDKALELNSMEIVVGASVDDTAFIDGLNQMIFEGKADAAQIQEYLNSIGYEPHITTATKEVTYFTTEGMSIETDFGNFKMPRFTIKGNVEVPVIDGGSEGSGGFSNYSGGGSGLLRKSGASGGLTSPTVTGGGGGGGGGGGSKYEPKTEEHLEEDPDRYQDVNAHLDRLSTNLEKVANEQDRLAGKDMLENMAEQVELIKQQAEWHQKKLDIQKEEAAELRAELGQDYGITFDSEGFMTNYQEIHKQLVAEYDALVDQYNATSDEEGQEKIKEKMDAVKEKIDDFNEAWERYDELMNNEIPESINTLEDLEDQIEDLRIEAFNAYVEASDNIKDIKDAWADYVGFVSGLKPDSPFRSLIEDAEKYENSIDLVTAKQENLEELMKWSSQYQPGGVITSDNPFGENSAEYYNALREAYDAYIEAVIDAESLYYDQIDDIIEAYDEIADKIEKRMENYAQLGEQLDHYASVMETLYGEEDYDNLLALKRANQDILESSVEQARKNLSMWQGELSKYNKETQPEIWEAIHEKVVEAQGELNGLVEDAAQNTAEILEMAIDKTIKEWKDTMLGGDSTWMETQWEMSKELAEQYLDAVEETYEIEKLRSKYNDLANSTMDLNLRKRINEQMELELEYLREKDKLSEFDVNYANAKLEILQKQIALEEAQANKNQMKLRRDSQGNYSYVYAADKDDVAQAESDLLDAEFNAYDMSKENYMTNYDNYISAVNSAAERIKEINANTLLSEEEKAKRTQEIYDWLNEYLSGIAEQIGVSQQGMIESVAWLAMDTTGIAGETFANISAMMQEDWTAALGAIGVATSENFDYIINHIDEFLAKTKEKWTEFEDHTYEWALNVQDIADEGTDGFRQVDDVILTIRNDMKDLNEETETFFGLINDDLGTIDKAVGKLSEYESQILGLKDSTSKIRAELNEANKLLLEKEKEIENLKGQLSGNNDDGGDGNGGSGGSSGSGGSGGSGGGDGKINIGDVVTYKGGRYYYDSAGTAPSGNRGPGKKVTVTYLNWGSKYPIHVESKDSAFGWLKQDQLEGFDTGGYTGKWGTDGRLAMLHQKELVLNAQDTENVLAAVSAVREIVSAIKSDSLSSFVSSFRNGNIASTNSNNIEQNVSIYADFPAAESAAEIKAALEGLTQQAIQYAKRTR